MIREAETGGAHIPAPLAVSDANSVAWDDSTDVLIIGFGGTGACAALEARAAGADTLVADRFDGGGATAFSGGIIYAGGTRFQQDAGFDDTADDMYAYLAMETGDVVKPETLRRFCDESSATVKWLAGLGVPYDGRAFLDKSAYPPEGYFLYYSGNEKVAEYAVRARPAPRGHRAVGQGMTGHIFYKHLAQAVERSGARIMRHATASRLVIDTSGRVLGAELAVVGPEQRAEHQRWYDRLVPLIPFKTGMAARAVARAEAIERGGAQRLVRARGGVVIATGGFSYNLDMLSRYQPFFADNVASLLRSASLGCNGSGIRLGQSVGGDLGKMDSSYVARTIAPPAALLRGMLVNQVGERFVNEEAYSGRVGRAIAAQPGGKAWLIVSGASLRQAFRQSFSSGPTFFKYFGVPLALNFLFGGTRRGRTAARLARACGIDAAGLEGTLRHNDAMAQGLADDPLGKSRANVEPLAATKLYALDMSIPNRFAFTMFFTLGGLRVDEASGAVVRADGAPIPGLYAGGRAAVGLCSHDYISGMSLADAVFSGRRAGLAAASAAQQI